MPGSGAHLRLQRAILRRGRKRPVPCSRLAGKGGAKRRMAGGGYLDRDANWTAEAGRRRKIVAGRPLQAGAGLADRRLMKADGAALTADRGLR